MKSILFSDIHYGKHNNSDTHNSYCSQFIDFLVDKTNELEFDNIVFLGDAFDNRTNINVKTLNCIYNDLSKLNNIGKPIYFIVGNHDCFNHNNRDITSVVSFSAFDNIHIINDITIIENVILVPYLFSDEDNARLFEISQTSKASYIFGHLEIEGFCRGKYQFDRKSLKSFKKVYSGHFHDSNTIDNITYIGNPFQMSFGEREDVHKGITIVDTNENIDCKIDWRLGPLYFKINVDQLEEVLELDIANDFYIEVSLADTSLIPSIRTVCDADKRVRYLTFDVLDAYDKSELIVDDSTTYNIPELITEFLGKHLQLDESFNSDLLNEIAAGELKNVTI